MATKWRSKIARIKNCWLFSNAPTALAHTHFQIASDKVRSDDREYHRDCMTIAKQTNHNFYQVIAPMVICIFAFLIAMTSCGKKPVDDSYKKKYSDVEQEARKSLQPLLHSGESITNLISRFGSPINKSELANGELTLDFLFSSEQEKSIQSANVHGFVGWFTNNQLIRWEPIFTAP